ncbi:ATP-binding protein [Streptomyces longisporoflavus]|uniref:ATP-binding protein n=1 Tax=Streptomyces longisporoflavus TaxID=28044 RepID=A0ABW7R418_9ACTN
MTMAAARPPQHPGYHLTLARTGPSAARARRLARTACTAWDVEEYSEVAQLVLCELVTNAVRHTHGHLIRVSVEHPRADRLVLAVTDTSRDLPLMGRPRAGDLRGRGLLLIDALTETWGSTRLPDGKRVWAQLAVKTGTQP